MLNSKNYKLKQEYEDDIYNNNLTEEFDDNTDDEFNDASYDDIDESDLSDDFEDKITIEEDYSYEISEDESSKFDLLYHFNTNKHKQEGKHRLKEDTIFKGKNDKKSEEYEEYGFEENNDYNDIINFFDYESVEYSNSVEQNNLTKDVYELLKDKTNIDFTQNRRKPNKETFNQYYNLLVKELGFKYSKSEMFVELSFYFTDNIFNMYKLLDKNSATIIIKELIKKGFLKNLENINFL